MKETIKFELTINDIVDENGKLIALQKMYTVCERIGDTSKFVRTAVYTKDCPLVYGIGNLAGHYIEKHKHMIAYTGLRACFAKSGYKSVSALMNAVVADSKTSAYKTMQYEQQIVDCGATLRVDSDGNIMECEDVAMTETKRHTYKLVPYVKRVIVEKNVMVEYNETAPTADGRRMTVKSYKMKDITRQIKGKKRVAIIPKYTTRKTVAGALIENIALQTDNDGIDYPSIVATAFCELVQCGLINSEADIFKYINYPYSKIRRALYQFIAHSSETDKDVILKSENRCHKKHASQETEWTRMMKSKTDIGYIDDGMANMMSHRTLKDDILDSLRIGLKSTKVQDKDKYIEICEMYFFRRLTLDEIGEYFGMSHQRVSTITDKIASILRTDEVAERLYK